MQNITGAQPFAAHPLAQLAAAFALGVLGAPWFPMSLSVLVFTAALATFFAALALFKTRERVATILVLFSMMLVGCLLAAIEKNKIPVNQLKRLLIEGAIAVVEPVELTGVLAREPELAPDRLYLVLKVEVVSLKSVDREVSGEVLLLAPVSAGLIEQEFDRLDLHYGARIRVMTVLERSDTFRNPGVSSFTQYLDRKGHDATGFVKSPLLIERLGNERVVLPLAWLYQWRRKLQTEIDSRFSRETAGVLNAALLGNRYGLSHATSERFREGGTFHVLVISGLHITFLGGMIFLITSRFTKNRDLQFLLSVVVLWSYSLAVGADPSVVRAALMFTMVLLAPLLFRPASSLNALGGAALALLVWQPTDLLNPSFQLTFVSVMAIVLLAWPLLKKMREVGSWRPMRDTPYPPLCASWLRSLCEIFYWSEKVGRAEVQRANYSYKLFKHPLAETLERLHLQRVMRYAFAAIAVSTCVQIALLPFLIIYFHRLPIASFILNIAVSLIMAGELIVALAALAIAQLSPTIAAPLFSLANYLNWLMVHSVDPFVNLGLASIRLPEYSGWPSAVYGVYYIPLAVLAILLSRWKPLARPKDNEEKRSQRIKLIASLAQVCVILLVVFHPLSSGRSGGKLQIDFLDVGQGDSAFVTFPNGTTLLIDGGGRVGPFKPKTISDSDGDRMVETETPGIGESVVSEYLWWRGLDRIDYVVATHADADHMDGLNDVARNFEIGAILVARTPSGDLQFSKLSATAVSQAVPIYQIGAHDILRFGRATGTVLWPPPIAGPDAQSGNNDSVVLLLQLGKREILLTGDIESAAEMELLNHDRKVNSLASFNRSGTPDFQIDVVKVAHHGSRTSSIESFVTATHPEFAVISVGQTSRFGHPHHEVVNRWKGSGAEVLTTGQSGMITVTTDGENLELRSFVPRSQSLRTDER